MATSRRRQPFCALGPITGWAVAAAVVWGLGLPAAGARGQDEEAPGVEARGEAPRRARGGVPGEGSWGQPEQLDRTTLSGRVELGRLVDLAAERLGLNIEYHESAEQTLGRPPYLA
jgi:hypothetical protein